MVDTGVLFVSYSAFQNVIRNFTHPGYDPSSPPSLSLSQLSLAAASAGLAHSFILYVPSKDVTLTMLTRLAITEHQWN